MSAGIAAGWKSAANDKGNNSGCGPLTDVKNPRLIYFKGLLFLFCGCLAAGLILYDHPSLRVAALLAISVWCFSRFYYFAFYVIEHYVDGEFRFAGLFAFFGYAVRRRFGWRQPPDDGPTT